MSIKKNLNVFGFDFLHGSGGQITQPNTKNVKLSENSTVSLVAGQSVKLSAGSGTGIVVELCTANDVPYGVIDFAQQKTIYEPNEHFTISCKLNTIYLRSHEDISRGDKVVARPADGYIGVAGNICLGTALTGGEAGSLIEVDIDPMEIMETNIEQEDN